MYISVTANLLALYDTMTLDKDNLYKWYAKMPFDYLVRVCIHNSSIFGDIGVYTKDKHTLLKYMVEEEFAYFSVASTLPEFYGKIKLT